MSGLVATIIITVILLLLAVAGLSIGYLLTGKSKLRMCGRATKIKRDDHCGHDITCPLCAPPKEKKKHDNDDDKS